jgi:hypothetical protein
MSLKPTHVNPLEFLARYFAFGTVVLVAMFYFGVSGFSIEKNAVLVQLNLMNT